MSACKTQRQGRLKIFILLHFLVELVSGLTLTPSESKLLSLPRHRMPGETIRDTSAVGRFPSVTLGILNDVGPAEEAESKQQNGCRQWLRKLCPCCQPKPHHDDMDDLVTANEGDPEEGKAAAEKPETSDSELGDLLLRVRSVDLMKSRQGLNRTRHYTHLYQTDALIVRRGQNFQMWLGLSRPFDPKEDKLHLILKTGPLPNVSKGTQVNVPVVENLEGGRWGAAVVKQEGNQIHLSVNTSATAAVGRYQLLVETTCTGGHAVSTHNPNNDVFILFNPWCEEDTVFMDSEEERQEYILNDVGIIYYGTQDQIGERTWNYGQFDDGILATCFFVLEKSGTPPSGWGDPVNVVRIISAMINSPDDDGVLEGNWSGNYSAGINPTVWSGSVGILRQYHKNNGVPVKYGQCWVFAGVCTTVLRCLGIPARTVTNYSSAHDTDVSLTTDVYLDENLEPIPHLNTDSIWNFHVWNDCWMARPDLPLGNGGWQAVDSTPQETSQGTFCCGPSSLTAVRNGYVYLKHDTPFVFAEVNSDKIYWQKNADGTFNQIYSEKKTVGHCISTKAVGSDKRHDITHLYKHAEGSEEERIAVETACRYGSKAATFSSSKANDVSVKVSMDGEGPKMGQDADLSITLVNGSSEHRTVALHSQLSAMYYTGVHKAIIGRDRTDVDIQPNEVKALGWTLEYKDYKDQLVDQAALMLTLSGRVKETQQVLATQFSFRLRTPDLTIKPLGEAVVGVEMAVKISFTNPLPRVLKAVIIHLEGLGLVTARKITYGDIDSLADVSVTEHVVPSLPGMRKLTASLDCEQLTQVHGVADITVEERRHAAS